MKCARSASRAAQISPCSSFSLLKRSQRQQRDAGSCRLTSLQPLASERQASARHRGSNTSPLEARYWVCTGPRRSCFRLIHPEKGLEGRFQEKQGCVETQLPVCCGNEWTCSLVSTGHLSAECIFMCVSPPTDLASHGCVIRPVVPPNVRLRFVYVSATDSLRTDNNRGDGDP